MQIITNFDFWGKIKAQHHLNKKGNIAFNVIFLGENTGR